jgi:exodeoxyribonuclease VII large subunit
MDHAMSRMFHEKGARLRALEGRLNALSPLAVLDRGYALVLDEKGALVRSANQVNAGDVLTTRLSDGAFNSRVESAAPNKRSGKRDQ